MYDFGYLGSTARLMTIEINFTSKEILRNSTVEIVFVC